MLREDIPSKARIFAWDLAVATLSPNAGILDIISEANIHVGSRVVSVIYCVRKNMTSFLRYFLLPLTKA